MLIPITSIVSLNRQRKSMDQGKLTELATSIHDHGLLQAIGVRRPIGPDELALGGEYVLCFGGRRLAAHILLGRSEIEATIKEELTNPLQARVFELEENIRRADLSWAEEDAARAEIHAIRLVENPTQTMKQTAAEIGVAESTIFKAVELAAAVKADPSLRAAQTRAAATRTVTTRRQIAHRLSTVAAVDLSALDSRLFTADGVRWAQTLPSASVDLILTDLPYGIDNIENVSSFSTASRGSFNDSAKTALDFIGRLVPEMYRIVKPTGWICLFICYEHHAWLMERLNLEADAAGTLVTEMPPWLWDRSSMGSASFGHHPDLHAANRYEMIVVLNGGQARLMKKPVENVLRFESVASLGKLHIHQKPHALCRELIERFTLPGERVVDFCFGSGAILAAAAEMGRDFAGSDSDPKNKPAAMSLISQFYHQGRKA